MKHYIKVILTITFITLTACAGMSNFADKTEGAAPARGY